MNRKIRLVATLLALSAVSQTTWVTQSLAAPQTFPPITDAAYLKECGSCHMAYPPEFLPARSWNGVIASLQDHFGDAAQLDGATQQRIRDYLVAHSADKAQNEHSFAIMRSLNASEAPLRITATPTPRCSIRYGAAIRGPRRSPNAASVILRLRSATTPCGNSR